MKKSIQFMWIGLLLCMPLTAMAGIEGVYTLDQDFLIKRAHKRIDQKVKDKKMSAARAKKAKSFAHMVISSMKMKIVLKKGGKYSSAASMTFMGQKRKSASTGTWSQGKDGNIAIQSQTTKGKRTIKRVVNCQFKAQRLACSSPNKSGRKQVMYFRKLK